MARSSKRFGVGPNRGTLNPRVLFTEAEIQALEDASHSQNTDTGTTGTTFHIDSDNTGPKIKNNSGALEARNSADDAYANMRGAQMKGTTGHFGDDTNYSEFESDGTLKFNGDATVFDDLQFAVSAGRVPPASAPNWEAFTTNTNEYAFDVDEYIDLQANEVFHRWKEGSTAEFHIHVTPKSANATGEDRFAKFILYVAYADADEVWTETSLPQELTIPDGTSALTHMLLDMGDVAFTNQLIGCQIKL
jgi:hypothetical protein